MVDQIQSENPATNGTTKSHSLSDIALRLRNEQVHDKYRAFRFDQYLEMVMADPRLIRNAATPAPT